MRKDHTELDLLVIGAQKSGSTFILRCLEEHPEISMPIHEVAFFEDPDYKQGQYSEKIESLFISSGPEQLLGIKRPNYLGQPVVPQRVARHAPNAKLVVVLRDPVERAVSAYFHYMRAGLIPIAPIEEGLPRILNGDSKHQNLAAAQIIDFGFYHHHLTRWLQYFSRENILILLYDQIKSNPNSLADQAYKFLGITTGFRPSATKRRSMIGIYSIFRLRLLNLVRPLTTLYFENGTRYIGKPGIVSRCTYLASQAIDKMIMSKILHPAPPKLSSELQSRLASTYRNDCQQLAENFDLPIQSWQPCK